MDNAGNYFFANNILLIYSESEYGRQRGTPFVFIENIGKKLYNQSIMHKVVNRSLVVQKKKTPKMKI